MFFMLTDWFWFNFKIASEKVMFRSWFLLFSTFQNKCLSWSVNLFQGFQGQVALFSKRFPISTIWKGRQNKLGASLRWYLATLKISKEGYMSKIPIFPAWNLLCFPQWFWSNDFLTLFSTYLFNQGVILVSFRY